MVSAKATDSILECTDDDIIRGLGGTEHGITVEQIETAIKDAGIICPQDPRVSPVLKSLAMFKKDQLLSKHEFFKAAADNLSMLHRIATKEMAISNFPTFTTHIDQLKELVEPDTSGQNADYIPILRDAPSDKFGVAFCSVDGQFHEVGDTRLPFSIQSTSKPLTYALAMEKLGADQVLQWCGVEPSGRPFNDVSLLNDSRPYNPMVNSGALMTAATLASAFPEISAEDEPETSDGPFGKSLCEKLLLPLWQRLSGSGIVGDVGFSEETFLSERKTADVNKGIAYLMKGRKGLPDNVHTKLMLDFYLRACSITTNAAGMAVTAATLANGGRNPISGDQVLGADVVKRTLSVLSFCGFYDNAGEFFYHTGVPSKSGVSGVVFLVLPNVGGFAIFSPRLDNFGNSVRGSAFAKQLVNLFTFHSFDSVSSLSTGCKLDPRFSCDFSRQRSISRLQWAARVGDRHAKKFDELLVDVCLRVALVDGNVEDSEIEELISVYKSVMQADLKRDEVERKLEDIKESNAGGVLEDLHELLTKEERQLNDVEKQLLIDATARVTVADGVVTGQEREILGTISRGLKVDPLVVEFHLSRLRREFQGAKKGGE